MANGEICMIKKQKSFKYIIALLCLMFILGCGNTEKNNLKSKESVSSQENIDDLEKRNINTYQELKLIGVVDTYANADELTTLFESYDALEKMSQFNEILNKKFDFFEIYNQPLQSKFYWNIDDDFLEYYDEVPMKNQEVEIDGKKYFISSLNSIEVNFNSYNYFLDYIDEGRYFVINKGRQINCRKIKTKLCRQCFDRKPFWMRRSLSALAGSRGSICGKGCKGR